MASVKIILDHRTLTKDGHPIKVKITHNRKSTTISTGISVPIDCWDAESGRVVKIQTRNAINAALTRIRASYDMALLTLESQGVKLTDTPSGVRSQLMAIINPSATSDGAKDLGTTLADAIQLYISSETSGRTAEIYLATLKRLSTYCDLDNTYLDHIDKRWLDDFDAYLSKASPAPSSRAIHLRNLRAVYNYALDHELTTCYPFRRYKMPSGVIRKRSMDIDAIRALIRLDLPRHLAYHRDMFWLTFLLIGINTKDLYNLKPPVNGRVDYIRAKTNRPYSLRVEPEAMEIIDRYKGNGTAVDIADRYSTDRIFSSKTNKRLKDIGMMSYISKDGTLRNICVDLSPYWARHSWATIAASLDIPKDTIAAALGHGGHTITDVYIDFDQHKIDEANRRVIDYVIGGIR